MSRVFGVELVQQGQDGPARVPVDHLDVVLEEFGVDNVRGGLAVEGVQVLPGGGLGGGGGGAVNAKAGGDAHGFARGLGVEDSRHMQGMLSLCGEAVGRDGSWGEEGGAGGERRG